MSGELSKSKEELRNLLTQGKILNTTEALSMNIATKIEEQLPINK
jgi:hypothetical protein